MVESVQIIAFFRSCLRKTFRDQVIKSLRGLPGEHTHTTYRSQWLTEEVIEYFASGRDFVALSILVDPSSEFAIPSRLMRPVGLPKFDSHADSWSFTFELSDYVSAGRRAEKRLRDWNDSDGVTPPNKFVSLFRSDWVKYHAVEYRKSKSDWKQSIDFIVDYWPDDFQESVFLRPSRTQDFKTLDTGPTMAVRQSEEVRIVLDSYNRHLSESQLNEKRLNVAVSDVMGDVATIPKLISDGEMTIPLTFLEPGLARVVVDVQPDAHFSAYVPIAVSVEQDPNVDPTGPRVLGPSWRQFLNTYVTDASMDDGQRILLFNRLNEVFPGEPELMLQRGMLHFRSGNFVSAREDFGKILERSNDPRGVWWSLVAALHLNDELLAHEMLERSTAVPSSEESRAAFESAISQLSGLPDTIIESFCELPRATMSDATSLQMLLQMTKGSRQECALLAVLKEIGVLSPEAALRELDRILLLNPDWRRIRELRARLALKANVLQRGDADAESLIQYAGQEVAEYMHLVQELKPLLPRQHLPSIMYASALQLFDAEDRDRAVMAISLATDAAFAAVANGDIVEAQRCLAFVELRLIENEGDNRRFRGLVNQVSTRVTDLLKASQAVAKLVDSDAESQVASFKSEFEGQALVVFGGHRQPEKSSRLQELLGLSQLEWISWQDSEAPNAKKLLEHAHEGQMFVVISVDDGLIPTEVRMKLRQKKVVMVRCVDSLSGILQALKSRVGSSIDPELYVPGTCAEALEWAQMRCLNLEFSAKVGSRISELDEYRHADRVRARIVSDLELLNRYALDAQGGRVRSGMKNWLVLNGFNAAYYASAESQTTSTNSRLREERTFSCSRGRVFMPEHFKLPGEYPTEGRIHFTTDFAARDGKVIIGYVGPHLPLLK